MVPRVTREAFDAVLFDLDGVLTTTRSMHVAAWKRTFDDVLQQWAPEHDGRTAPFDEDTDYATYVDGKPRQDGVRDFLASRGIHLPDGSPDSPPEELSVWGVGNRKQLLVEDELARHGVDAFPGSVRWVQALRQAGFRTAVVSSSRNCSAILVYAGIASLFDAVVDGDALAELRLAGKPAPDAYLEGARRLGVPPGRAVVVEDAIAGVEAGRAGNFGLVIGVDRDGDVDQLRAHGADVVVTDLGQLVTDGSVGDDSGEDDSGANGRSR
jgi:alpha,alpha-trehalose phosphorylase